MIDDGGFHDYVLDLSTPTGWTGEITRIRFAPVTVAGRIVEIDGISFAGS